MKKIATHLRENWIKHCFEILVVAIGVLAAFGLNDWNEWRKTRIKEIGILEDLIQGLEQDLNVINYNIDKHERAKKSCEIILKVIEEDAGFTDSLAPHFASIHYYTVSNFEQPAYESLKSIGFEIISNKELRLKLIELYAGWFKILDENQKLLTDDIFSIKRNFNQDHFDKFFLFDTSVESFYAGHMIPNDFANLKKDKQFKYHLKSLHAGHSTFLFQNYITVDTVNDLIKELENEINQLK
jgi:hypothetical protein